MTLSAGQLRHADTLARKHRERAAAVAEEEWRRAVDAMPTPFQMIFDNPTIEEIFKRCARLAYLAGKGDALADTAALIDATKAGRQLRMAGRNPAGEN